MRLSEVKTPRFDPSVRLKEAKTLHIFLTPEEWAGVEVGLGKHTNSIELKELILGLFSGKYKVVER